METPLSEAQFSSYFLTGTNALFCHVALETSSGDPIGFQAVGRHPDLPEGWGDIATFARLDPKVPGVGTMLFPQTLRRADDCSISVLNAMIRADNASGLAYYRKMGFLTYRTLEAVPLDNGRRVDRILKRYDLA